MVINPNTVLLVGGGLGLVLLVVGVLTSLLSGRSVVEERLGRYVEGGGLVAGGQEEVEARTLRTPLSDFLNRLVEGTSFSESISKNLAQADLKFRPAEYIALIIIAAVLSAIVGSILGRSIVFGLIAGIAGAFLPNFYVRRARSTRLKLFDNQLGDMLNLMVNGLRAGFSTLQAMEAVSREMPPPICDEFRRVVQEMQLGIAMEEALDHLLRRINSDDLDMVITAITVQREVGGNLAEILDVISYTIRERVRIKGEIQALTAQGRATAYVISFLPIALVLLLFFINRPYVMQFFNPETRTCGIPMLCTAAGMIIAGFFTAQKIVDIDI